MSQGGFDRYVIEANDPRLSHAQARATSIVVDRQPSRS